MWADLHARLRGFVSQRVADPYAADDLAQDILLRIHQHMGELRDADRLVAWAYQVARRAIIDYYRTRASQLERPGGDLPDQADPRDGEQAGLLDADGDEVRTVIAGCLALMVGRLPEPYRQAIELTDLGDLTQAAAAERLELSVPGMKTRVQRGRQKLRDMLLDCCRFATDSRGTPTEFEPRRPSGCGADGC